MKLIGTTLALTLTLALGCGAGASETGPHDETPASASEPVADAEHCVHEGELVDVGFSIPADDGCNTCTCDGDDRWACTEIGCVDGE